MNIFRGLASGILFGWNAGLLLGAVDAIARVLAKRFEWYELYLALLLPSIVLALFFGLLALFHAILFQKLPLQNFLVQASLCFTWLVLAGLSFNLSRAHTSALQEPIINAIGVSVIFLATIFSLRRPEVQEILAGLKRRYRIADCLSAYRFMASFLVVFCLIYDSYSLSFPNIRQHQYSGEAKPNILLITLDTVRARSLTPYTPELPSSPFLASLAEQSVVFEQASASSSWTLPSHASIFTGKQVAEHSAHFYHQLLDPTQFTLAEALTEKGYRTGAVIAGPYMKLRYGLAQGFSYYFDRLDFFEYFTLYERFSIRRLLEYLFPGFSKYVLHADGELIAPQVHERALHWLESSGDAPYFLFLNFFDAHDPYNLGREFRHLFVNEDREDQEVFDLLNSIQYSSKWSFESYQPDPTLANYLTGIYHAEIRYLDSQLELLFQHLQQSGLLDNTIVIITADHGEEFFEHGGIQHGQTLYEEVTHVPLIFYFPEEFSPARISTPVSLQSLFDTILELVDTEPRSFSLVDLLYARDTASGAAIIAELYGNPIVGGNLDMKSFRQGKFKLIDIKNQKPRIPDGLYNLESDSGEQVNLIDKKPDTALQLRSRLLAASAKSEH